MTGGENRRISIIKALRKKRIDKNVHVYFDRDGYYENLHQYSKNKIHCSCPMCAAKTRGKTIARFKKFIPGGADYKISDVKKIQRLEYTED